MTQFKDQTLLVTGAAGHFGRIAIDELLARGATKIIAGTRDPSKLADLATKGVTVRALDFDKPEDLATAFNGVDRVLLISTDSIGRRAEQQIKAVKAAAAAGVKHFVYTSAPNANPNPGNVLSNEHFATEQALANSGATSTILRNHLYAEVILYGASSAVAGGALYDATGDGLRSYVWREDAARTAAGALLSAEGNAILDVTGPAPVAQAEVAGLLAELSGKPVNRVGLTGEQLKSGMVANGLPEAVADLMVNFDIDAAKGYHALSTDVVETFSGRKPQSVAAFLATNKAAFA
ncbi:NAD(P)H-binding protein [Devosia sp.]|uniref:NAD(P)H-binding protein n=1 Tax=Devosia sp. TaxID=1871048 RepID=UPI0032663768